MADNYTFPWEQKQDESPKDSGEYAFPWEQKKEKPSRSIADLGRDFLHSAIRPSASLASATGNYGLAEKLDSIVGESDFAKKLGRERADRSAASVNGSVMDKVKAGINNLTEDVSGTIGSTVGGLIPYAVAGKLAGPKAATALMTATATGDAKQKLYSAAKDKAIRDGMTPDEAEKYANQEASYFGANTANIATDAAVGYAAGKYGSQGAVGRLAGMSEAQLANKMAGETIRSAAGREALIQGAVGAGQAAISEASFNEANQRRGYGAQEQSALASAIVGGGTGALTGGAFGAVEKLAAKPLPVEKAKANEADLASPDTAKPLQDNAAVAEEQYQQAKLEEDANAAKSAADKVPEAPIPEADPFAGQDQSVPEKLELLDPKSGDIIQADPAGIAGKAIASVGESGLDVANAKASPNALPGKQDVITDMHPDSPQAQYERQAEESKQRVADQQAKAMEEQQKAAIEAQKAVEEASRPSTVADVKNALKTGDIEGLKKHTQNVHPDTAMGMLKDAAKTGNADAIDHLVSMDYSDGNSAALKIADNVTKNIGISQGNLIREAIARQNASKDQSIPIQEAAIPAPRMEVIQAPKEERKTFTVNGNEVDYGKLSVEQKAAWDQAQATHDRSVDLAGKLNGGDRKLEGKNKKAAAMELSAARREITGLLTETEIANKAKKDAVMRAGDFVSTPLGDGEFVSRDNRNGTVKVRINGGGNTVKIAASEVTKNQKKIEEARLASSERKALEDVAKPVLETAPADLAPVNKSTQTRLSKVADQSGETLSREELTQNIRDAMNAYDAGSGDKLMQHRLFNIDSAKEASVEKGVRGLVESDGNVRLIHDNIPSTITVKELQGLVLHEVGVHAKELGLSSKAFQEVLAGFSKRMESDSLIKKAFKSVPEDTSKSGIPEEALARYIEANPTSSIANRVVALLKAATRDLVKNMNLDPKGAIAKWANELTHTDYLNLAKDGLRKFNEEGQVANEASSNDGRRFSKANEEQDRSLSFKVRDGVKEANVYLPEQAENRLLKAMNIVKDPSKDGVISVIQNRYIDLKRIVDATKDAGINVKDSNDPWLAVKKFFGSRAEVHEKMERDVTALLEKAKDAKISEEQLSDILTARHIINDKANQEVAKSLKEGELPEERTGMSDEKAKTVLSEANPLALEIAKSFHNGYYKYIETAHNDGLISSKRYLEFLKYSDYVPWIHSSSELGSGEGFSVTGGAFKIRGEVSKGQSSALSLIIHDQSRLIDLMSKTKVGRVLGDFFETHIDSKIARVIDMNKAFRDANTDITSDHGIDIVKDREGNDIPNPDFIRSEHVISFIDANGKQKAIVFDKNNPRLLRAVRNLKNLDEAQLGPVLASIGNVTRLFSSLNTQWNPVFGPFNFVRDAGHATLALQKGELKGHGLEVVKNSMSMMKTIFEVERARFRNKPEPNTPEAQRYRKFLDEGGATGFTQSLNDPEAKLEHLQKLVDGKLISRMPVLKQLNAVIEPYNKMFENSLRMAAYEKAISLGNSPERSVQIAKDVTVDFNMKGTATTQMGSLYSFFNASIQGSERVFNALTESDGKGGNKLSSLGVKILAGGVGIGFSQVAIMAASGLTPDEIDEGTLGKFFIIPNAFGKGKDFKVPYPPGFSMIPSASRHFIQAAVYGDVKKHVGGLFTDLLDNFNPVGGNSSVAQALSPTILDPAVQIAENKDGFSRQIARLDRESDKPTPGFTRHKESTSPVAIAIAKGINTVSGGNEVVKGVLSPTPDQLSFLTGVVTGGPGRLMMQVFGAGSKAYSGDDVRVADVPLASRFVSDRNSPNAVYSQFSNNSQTMNEHVATLKAMQSGKIKANWGEYIKSNPEAVLLNDFKQTDALVKKKAEEMTKFRDNPMNKASDEQKQKVIKGYKDELNRLKEQFNQRYYAKKYGEEQGKKKD